eukprot:CCRYP_014885-RA/>CCRYP_014885-RA protein AED:0.46 eAED:0.69 QI:0/0/0/1/0/0/3/0/212
MLVAAAPSFPVDCWDLLIPQAKLTLNLLHASHCNPNLSVWEDIISTFNFDTTPLGPVGCYVPIHSKATTHRSWDYWVQSLQHYCYYLVLSKESWAVAITDEIKFRHNYLPSPDLTAEDKIIAALQQLRITTKSPTAQLQAIYKLHDISATAPLLHPTTTQHLQGCKHYLQRTTDMGHHTKPRFHRHPLAQCTSAHPAKPPAKGCTTCLPTIT